NKIVQTDYLLENFPEVGARFHIMANSNVGLQASKRFFKYENGILLKNFVINSVSKPTPPSNSKFLIHVANYFPEKDFKTLLHGYHSFLSQSKETLELIIYCKFFRVRQLR